MASSALETQDNRWLTDNGPKELELLLRAVVYHPSEPILIADNDRHYREASSGAGKLLRLSREKVIGRILDEFIEADFKPRLPELWQKFLQRGEQDGTLRLVDSDGNLLDVEYTAKGNVLPVRHLLVLRAKPAPIETADKAEAEEISGEIPAWVRDYAFFLLNAHGIFSPGIREPNAFTVIPVLRRLANPRICCIRLTSLRGYGCEKN